MNLFLETTNQIRRNVIYNQRVLPYVVYEFVQQRIAPKGQLGQQQQEQQQAAARRAK